MSLTVSCPGNLGSAPAACIVGLSVPSNTLWELTNLPQ